MSVAIPVGQRCGCSPRTRVMTWLRSVMFTVEQEKPRPVLGSAASAFSDMQGRCWKQFLSSLNMCSPPKRVKCWNSWHMCSWLCWLVWWRKASGYAEWVLSQQYQDTSEGTCNCFWGFFETNKNELQRQCRGGYLSDSTVQRWLSKWFPWQYTLEMGFLL